MQVQKEKRANEKGVKYDIFLQACERARDTNQF